MVERIPQNTEELVVDDVCQVTQRERRLSPQIQHCGESPMVCLYSNCDAEPFNTNAALNQHYLRAHLSQRRRRNEELFCDYKDCDRRSSSFEHLDGLRNHLRAAHKESIPKKGGASKNALDAGRGDQLPWRRCPKCLGRIDSNHELDDCPNCNSWKHDRYDPLEPPPVPADTAHITENEPSANCGA